MKLSEMNVRQLSAALCQLVQPMANIAKEEDLNGLFNDVAKKMQANKRMTRLEKMGELLPVITILLEKRYADTIRIVAVMTDRTDAEVEEMNGFDMVSEMIESIDKKFMDFFKSAAVMDQTPTDKGE
jgi:hypothetical protein